MMEFLKATEADIEAVCKLYDAVCDRLAEIVNYPGWSKGEYPACKTAVDGVAEQSLYICKSDGAIAGTIILRHTPEDGYKKAKWLTDYDYSDIFVVYTLAVHPNYLKKGVGKFLMDSAEEVARKEGIKSIRLDVVEGNIPAEALYKKCDYKFIDTVSLGYEMYGLPRFNLYEKVLK